ncbi:MAG: multiheme c-type cytochrome [Desulfobacterales bacterium]
MKPAASATCPDHPQIEIYTESKHGDIYAAFGDEYNWTSAPGTWSAGVDFRGPTCLAYVTGAVKNVLHDVTERLSWELQAPLTVRPEDFAAFPAHPLAGGADKMKESAASAMGTNGSMITIPNWTK